MEGEAGGLLLAMLVAGFASGVHCVGMCGGIVTAFSMPRAVPIVPAARAGNLARQLAVNAGRITSYAAGGAVAGSIGSLATYLAGAAALQTVLYAAANSMLVLVGLYLMGADRALARLEALGGPVWRRVQPLAARGLAARTLPMAYGAGLAWGWLPCGLVYGALAAAAFAGSPAAGALVMLAFGLGTLPNLLVAGLAAAQLRAWVARRAVRLGAGALVLGFGVFGLAHASGVAEVVRRAVLCL